MQANPHPIAWTNIPGHQGCTWNPNHGCTKISPACKWCYAERTALRLQRMGTPGYEDGFAIKYDYDKLDTPQRWKKPRAIFVSSMGELFHEKIPDDFILGVFRTIELTPRHLYLILTKCPERIPRTFGDRKFPPNVWLGITTENREQLAKRYKFVQNRASLLFLSAEPLLDELDLDGYSDIKWVIAGGETGAKARPTYYHWMDSLKTQCEDKQIPFFWKQWGEYGPDTQFTRVIGRYGKHKTGHLIHGKEYREFPKCVN